MDAAELDEAANDLDPLTSLSLPQIRRALARIETERLRQDEVEGFCRDYPEAGKDGWPERVAADLAAVVAQPVGSVVRAREVLALAVTATHWLEAVELRRQERRLSVVRAPWWRRLLARWRR